MFPVQEASRIGLFGNADPKCQYNESHLAAPHKSDGASNCRREVCGLKLDSLSCGVTEMVPQWQRRNSRCRRTGPPVKALGLTALTIGQKSRRMAVVRLGDIIGTSCRIYAIQPETHVSVIKRGPRYIRVRGMWKTQPIALLAPLFPYSSPYSCFDTFTYYLLIKDPTVHGSHIGKECRSRCTYPSCSRLRVAFS